ncbi:PDR/VanB family oxidoreductase [soil metagenome]
MTVATMGLVVTAVDERIAGIRSIRLSAPTGEHLPQFVAGSHLTLDCGGRRNSYSLTNDGLDPAEYCLSILHVRDGRGGSRWVHEQLTPGSSVTVTPPRSAFAPIGRAAKHLLIAGGIGVTPILSHLRSTTRWGQNVQVLYSFREGAGAHIDDIVGLVGAEAELFTDQDQFCLRLPDVLADQPVGTHLYVCGPGPMIDFVLGAAVELGWPPSRLHLERFGANIDDPGEAFEVTLTASGRTLQVPSGTTLLEVLASAGVPVPNMCRQGVCGECRIPVSGGVPLHRDLFLDATTKDSGTAMMCCVSRAVGPNLEIPL